MISSLSKRNKKFPCGKTYSNKSFRKAAVNMWNNLPMNIRKCETFSSFMKMRTFHFMADFAPNCLYI